MMFNFLRKRKPTLDEILVTLNGLGFGFKSEIAKTKAIEELTEASIDSVELVLAIMGDEQYDANAGVTLPWLSDDVWHFDYEAIEDHGAYKSIVENCVRICKGDLKLTEILDFVDVEHEKAWVEFRQDGHKRKLHLEVDNDWADPKLFAMLNEILDKNGSSKRLAQHVLGQDALITCKLGDELIKVNSQMGLSFQEIEG